MDEISNYVPCPAHWDVQVEHERLFICGKLALLLCASRRAVSDQQGLISKSSRDSQVYQNQWLYWYMRYDEDEKGPLEWDVERWTPLNASFSEEVKDLPIRLLALLRWTSERRDPIWKPHFILCRQWWVVSISHTLQVNTHSSYYDVNHAFMGELPLTRIRPSLRDTCDVMTQFSWELARTMLEMEGTFRAH